jgi:hypothetical protein
LHAKKANPALCGIELDLGVETTRDEIRRALVDLMHTVELRGRSQREICDRLAETQAKRPLDRAAFHSARAMNGTNLIARLYVEDYPQHAGLRDLVQELTRTCGSGAAQLIGPFLPSDVFDTWRYFAQLFLDARRSSLWPRDLEPTIVTKVRAGWDQTSQRRA